MVQRGFVVMDKDPSVSIQKIQLLQGFYRFAAHGMVYHGISGAEIAYIILFSVYRYGGGVRCHDILREQPLFQVSDACVRCPGKFPAETINASF